MNVVSKRENKILKNMVRSIITYTTLPNSLEDETSKIIVYLLNIVPTKVIKKTYYELSHSKKPILKHLHVCSGQAE